MMPLDACKKKNVVSGHVELAIWGTERLQMCQVHSLWGALPPEGA